MNIENLQIKDKHRIYSQRNTPADVEDQEQDFSKTYFVGLFPITYLRHDSEIEMLLRMLFICCGGLLTVVHNYLNEIKLTPTALNCLTIVVIVIVVVTIKNYCNALSESVALVVLVIAANNPKS
uniref:Uncharacterized protein n=1 Tax=Glossina palpalis gambiensis TaxID=67801 RepID=A0A1B0B875_9MUSC